MKKHPIQASNIALPSEDAKCTVCGKAEFGPAGAWIVRFETHSDWYCPEHAWMLRTKNGNPVCIQQLSRQARRDREKAQEQRERSRWTNRTEAGL